MTRVLFAAHPTVGHTNALRAIGVRLLSQGHEVGMALVTARLPFADRWPEPIRVAATLSQKIAEDGIEIFPLNISPATLWYGARLPQTRGQEELGLALRLFTSGMKHHALRIAKYIRKWEADIVVGDYLMPAAMLGAKLAQRQYVALYHTALPFPVKDAPPFGSGLVGVAPDSKEWIKAEKKQIELFRFFDMRVTRTASALGVAFERKSLLTRPISDDLNLLTTTPEVEPGLSPLHGPIVMTGPCLPQVNDIDQEDPALAVIRGDMTSIYISLGTIFNKQPHVYDAIIGGISDLDVQIIISAGASLDQLSKWSNSTTHIFQRVPQVALLPRVDIIVTHGGNNTVLETLVAGKPMVVVPFGCDQIVNAQRVEQLGVGVSVQTSELNRESICRAIKTAMRPAMIESARAIGYSLKQYNGTETAARKILELATGTSIK